VCHGSASLTPVLNTLIGGALGAGVAVFAEPLRRWIYRPTLELDFGNGPEYQARTQAGESTQLHDADYLRLRVINTKSVVAKSCRVYLVDVEKKDESGQFAPTIYCDSIPLAWSCREEKEQYGAIDLPKGVKQFVDVISTHKGMDAFTPHIKPMTYRYMPLFREHGVFRLTIQVSGENVEPVFMKIIFHWTGVWDQYEAYGS